MGEDRHLEGDVREGRRLGQRVVVRGDGEADMIFGPEPDPVIAAGMREPPVRPGDREIDIVALALEPDPGGGCVGCGDDLAGRPVLRLAILERDQAVAMDHDVGIRRARSEVLPDHQARLAVRVAVRPGIIPGDIGGNVEIARAPRPDKMKGVGLAPDVGAAAGDPVAPVLVAGHAGMTHGTDVLAAIERTDPRRRDAGRTEQNQPGQGHEEPLQRHAPPPSLFLMLALTRGDGEFGPPQVKKTRERTCPRG